MTPPACNRYDEEASRLASQLGLPLDWLNDAVKGLLPDCPDPRAHTYYSSPGIDVSVASAEFLFAMKAMAARVEVDTEDLLVLARVIGLTTSEQALELVERFYDRGRREYATALPGPAPGAVEHHIDRLV